MKNLLIYINPAGKFIKETEVLARVQIDNALSLGWAVQDILLITNFPYEYNGVKAVVVGLEHFIAERPRSINTTTIPYLIDAGLMEKNTLYWVHDFDAYQNVPIREQELGLEEFDCGLTDYGWKPRLCMGSYFVKRAARDIFQNAKQTVLKNVEDEAIMTVLMKNPNISRRCKIMNITYNFGMRNVEQNWERANRPLRVVHFHPYYPLVPTLDIFMYGKNGLGIPLISERLIKIFQSHGIK